MGAFKERRVDCKSCQTYWFHHEEKETDVNVALHIVRDALLDKYDRAYVITGDSDIAPAFRMVKNIVPEKELVTVATPGRRHSKEIIPISDHKLSISEADLKNSMLPEQVHRADGKIFYRPKVWK